jgi:hypothetical protein
VVITGYLPAGAPGAVARRSSAELALRRAPLAAAGTAPAGTLIWGYAE